MRTISEIRADFETTDCQLAALLEHRIELACEMAEVKRSQNMPIVQEERRREVLQQWIEKCPSYGQESIETIYAVLHGESVKKQQGL